ncbi:MAG: class I SAM-dependent methyltransferase [Candidatus Margulisiibacteriota bacterium]
MTVSLRHKDVAERFVKEKLADHWKVDGSSESFALLLEHIEKTANFRSFFEEALNTAFIELDSLKKKDNLVVYDVGSGVSWTSAIMARYNRIKHLYAVDPSEERLKHAKYIMRHFQVPEGKADLITGTFSKFPAPEKADMIVYAASFHHCYDSGLQSLFSRAKEILAPGGIILITNEHYVNRFFIMKRIFEALKGKHLFSDLRNIRAPHPFDGEHWRTRGEINDIFAQNEFRFNIHVHTGDLCKDKKNLISKLAFKYYYAILQRLD